jgi:hypothetical protein
MKRYTQDFRNCHSCPALHMNHGAFYCAKRHRYFGKREGPSTIPSWCPLPAAPEENAIPKTECRINQWKGTQKP